jgi:transposase
MRTTKSYSPEIKERAVRLVQEQRSQYPSQWAAISSIAAKLGCTAETLRSWVKRAEQDRADGGQSMTERERLKQLE